MPQYQTQTNFYQAFSITFSKTLIYTGFFNLQEYEKNHRKQGNKAPQNPQNNPFFLKLLQKAL